MTRTKSATTKLRLWPFGLVLLALLGVAGGGLFLSVRNGVLLERHPEAARKLARVLDRFGMSDGTTVHTNDLGRLEVRRVAGIPVEASWNGEFLPVGRVRIKQGILTALSEEGRVLADLPLDQESRASWEALSTHRRLGLWLDAQADGLAVLDVDATSPAGAAGVIVGDVVTHIGGQPAAEMWLRAALIGHIVGGELRLTVRRGGESREVELVLSALMPPEPLAGSHDVLGDYLRYAQAEVERRDRDMQHKTELMAARLPGEMFDRLVIRLADTTLDPETDAALRRAVEQTLEGLHRSTSISSGPEGISYAIDFEPQQVRQQLGKQLVRELARLGIGKDDPFASQLQAIVHAADDLDLAHFELEAAAAN